MSKYSKDELDNHSNQLNPNSEAYWSSRDKSDDDDYEKKADDEDDDDSNDDDGYEYSSDGWDSSDY